ncbi:MAG: hypothetical protein II726_02760, partial [Elusimicrobiaceae bacterium]|nr:hypothetical protein [Elusimicrobiaceae bacterium]
NSNKNYFKSFNFVIYFILVLCLLGLLRNILFLNNYHALGQNVNSIFIAMIMIYFSQIILILLKQWQVYLISLLQVIFCIYVFPDFSILPFSAVIKFVFFDRLIEGNYAWAKFINFMFISFGFSVEIIKTYLLYVYFPRNVKQQIKN